MSTIAVIGSREFPNLRLVVELVKALPADTHLISGDARGVDRAAQQTAALRKLTWTPMAADWNGPLGLGAGMARNTEIVEVADEVYAFISKCWNPKCLARSWCPGRGWSHGTHDVITKTVHARKPLTVINEKGRSVQKNMRPEPQAPDGRIPCWSTGDGKIMCEACMGQKQYSMSLPVRMAPRACSYCRRPIV